MKLKMIVVIISLVVMSNLVADCSKSEYVKFIDKGFTKSDIEKICGVNKDSKLEWIDPLLKCALNGGYIDITKGMCEATWFNAKEICSASNARLPSIEELQIVIKSCYGDNLTFSSSLGLTKEEAKDSKYISYKSCFKSLGFLNYYYWSSDTDKDNSEKALSILFMNTSKKSWKKSRNDFYVRCVK